MSDDTAHLDTLATQLDAELTKRGFADHHAVALDLLMPNPDEREGVAVYIARNLVEPDAGDGFAASCAWWAAITAAALRKRHPDAPGADIAYAAHALTLIAMTLDPATLPAAGLSPPPGLVN